MSRTQQHIIVIGAGVTGLTSANFLADAGYLVTVVAAWLPGDTSIEYTSPWAGAHWHPGVTAAQPMLCDWDVQTYKYWLELLEREARQDASLPRAGIKMQDSYLFWDTAPPEPPWWAPHVRAYRALTADDADDGALRALHTRSPASTCRATTAAVYRAPSLDAPRYLVWLCEQGAARGVRVVRSRLPADRGLAGAMRAAEEGIARRAEGGGALPAPAVFVNATGLAAGALCGDASVYPVRGQTVLVRGEAAATRVRKFVDGTTAYCIPRPGSGMTILGGTREKGVWEAEPDATTTKRILERNAWMVPELLTAEDGGFEVVSVQCGLRPGRRDGPRVEREVVGGRKVVHAYGHEGSGYQHSVGSARLVVKLVGESLEDGPRL